MKGLYLSIALLLLGMLSVTSCSQGVSQDDYDRISLELSNLQDQLASLQESATEAEIIKTQNQLLNEEYDDLKAQYDEMAASYEEMEDASAEFEEQYHSVRSALDDLENQYDDLMAQCADYIDTGEILTEDIEEGIFDAVNQARVSQGLDEMGWGDNIYKKAISNCRDMAEKDSRRLSDYGAYQAVFWATGYHSTSAIVNATMYTWENEHNYENIFMNPVTQYAAVAVYLEGDIYYISYISDYYR